MQLRFGTSHRKSLLSALTQAGGGELSELVLIQHKEFSLVYFKSSMKDDKITQKHEEKALKSITSSKEI